MKIDAPVAANLGGIAKQARKLEEVGYDGLRLAELNADPFMPLAIAAEHTNNIELVTSVAVAFSRNPMTMAILAHDLNTFSQGRLVLGLGSQVKPHIERRFSMPWHKAAAQMREFIEAMQAIFDCWYDGKRLEYVGEYYQHTLMPATFTPDEISPENWAYQSSRVPRPRLALSATGPLMTKVAAELADGMIMHPFSSEQYMREVTLPAISAGLEKSGRTMADFDLDYAPMIATAQTEQGLNKAIAQVRGRIAFYGCTVAYKPVLDIHGWGDIQDELISLNRAHNTQAMADLITDEMVDTIAIVGSPQEVVDKMKARFGGVIARTSFAAADLDDDTLRDMLAQIRAP